MQNVISSHIRANIVGYIALFCFVMGGSAYAVDGPLPGQNQVGSSDIINGEVKSVDVGANSVTGDKIVDHSVTNADLRAGAVSSRTIGDGSIQGVDVKNNTLTGTQINELALDLSLLQKRIASTCAPGQAIRAVAQNGTVTCQSVGSGGGSSWLRSGNGGTTGADFLGTTDNQPLNLRVNNARGLRIEPASDGTNQSPNVIGGIADNSATPGVFAATIGGGGREDPSDPASANRVTDNEGTVGGGANNQAGDGAGTVSDRPGATVGGGLGNTARGEHATIGGGIFNAVNGSRATVAGGQFNGAGGDSATVAGGTNNAASGDRGFVGGGNANLAGGQGSVVAGGDGNHATGDWATVPGGNQSTAQGELSLAAGLGAHADNDGAFVWADSNPFLFSSTAQNQFNVRSTGGARLVSGIDGSGNATSGLELPAGTSGWATLVNGKPFDITVNGSRAFRIDPASNGSSPAPNVIAGGDSNATSAGVHGATIAGGAQPASDPTKSNTVTDSFGAIGGGANNQAGDGAGLAGDKAFATVGGGQNNVASGGASTVGGGDRNVASGLNGTVPGGFDNSAQGDYSFAAGRGAEALSNGAFVWADSNPFEFFSSAANEFSVRSTGGARFVSAIDGTTGTPTAGVQLAPGGGSWSSLSDRNSKRAIEPVSGKKVLRKLASVPVSTWSYKAQDRSIRHIGPMAQDFYKAFGVGEDRRHIDSVDADGVALAGIKGLYRRVRSQHGRLRSQADRIATLEREVRRLADRSHRARPG